VDRATGRYPETLETEEGEMKRPRGYGSVFQMGRVWWIRPPNGKRESSGSTVRKDAENLLQRRLDERRVGHHPNMDATKYEDLEALFLADLRTQRRRSLGNVEKWRLPYLRESFAGKLARDIDYGKIAAYAEKRLEKAAPATVRQEVGHLKRMFRLGLRAKAVGTVPDFPTVAVGDNARQGFVDPDAMERLIGHLPEHAKGPARCLYLTGWRTGEILELEWARVDFARGTIRLHGKDTKSGKGRLYPFSAIPALVELFKAQRARVSAEERKRGRIIPVVFPYNGDALGSFRGAWRTAREAAGLPGLRPHDLRRSTARNLRNAGVPEGVIMKLCGWATRSMFDRYGIVDERDLVDGVERLRGFLDAKALEDAAKRIDPLIAGQVVAGPDSTLTDEPVDGRPERDGEDLQDDVSGVCELRFATVGDA
jgi:integrase